MGLVGVKEGIGICRWMRRREILEVAMLTW